MSSILHEGYLVISVEQYSGDVFLEQGVCAITDTPLYDNSVNG